MNKSLLIGSVVWALISTGLLLWGILGTAPWDNSQRDVLCEDALSTRRQIVTNPEKLEIYDSGIPSIPNYDAAVEANPNLEDFYSGLYIEGMAKRQRALFYTAAYQHILDDIERYCK